MLCAAKLKEVRSTVVSYRIVGGGGPLKCGDADFGRDPPPAAPATWCTKAISVDGLDPLGNLAWRGWLGRGRGLFQPRILYVIPTGRVRLRNIIVSTSNRAVTPYGLQCFQTYSKCCLVNSIHYMWVSSPAVDINHCSPCLSLLSKEKFRISATFY